MRACRLVRERDEYGWLARRIIRELELKRTRRWNDAAPWDTRKLASTGAEIARSQRMHRIYDKQLKEGVRSGSGRPLDTLFFTTASWGRNRRTLSRHALLASRTLSSQDAPVIRTYVTTDQPTLLIDTPPPQLPSHPSKTDSPPRPTSPSHQLSENSHSAQSAAHHPSSSQNADSTASQPQSSDSHADKACTRLHPNAQASPPPEMN